MGEVPYRLWSDKAPEPAPPVRTIIAKLKPSTREGRRAAFGVRAAGPDHDRPSQLARLIDNDRLRAIRPVFPEEAVARGGRRGLVATRAPVQRARGLVAVDVARDEDPQRMARHLENLGGEVEYAFVPQARSMFAKRKRAKVDPLMSRQ